MQRPNFNEIKNFDEFEQYYWYREELKQICSMHGIAYMGTKQELNNNIKAYFNGEIIKPVKKRGIKKIDIELSLETKILECGFVLNGRFREYFANITGVENFKFTANMATALRTVREVQDIDFNINDLLMVYYGKSDYAKYDSSSCQWNQFLKDFCCDENSKEYSNKLKAASILWKLIREKPGKKVYSNNLLKEYELFLKEAMEEKND